MGEAKRRGTYEERKAVITSAEETRRAEERARYDAARQNMQTIDRRKRRMTPGLSLALSAMLLGAPYHQK